jgi:hypothetical protein
VPPRQRECTVLLTFPFHDIKDRQHFCPGGWLARISGAVESPDHRKLDSPIERGAGSPQLLAALMLGFLHIHGGQAMKVPAPLAALAARHHSIRWPARAVQDLPNNAASLSGGCTMSSPRRWRAPWSLFLLVLLGLVLLITGTATWFLMPPPKVTARTMLYIAETAPNILYELDKARGSTFMRTQMSFLRSPFVLRAALRDPEVTKLSMIRQLEAEGIDPQQWLEEKLEVEAQGAEFLRIGISGDKPEELKTLVRAVTRAYMQQVVGEAPRKRKEQLEKLKAVRKRFLKDLKNLQDKLKPAEEKLGVIDPEILAAQQKLAEAELQTAKKEYIQARTARRKLQVELGLPETGGSGWESFAAAMSVLPGPVPPVNFELIGLLFDQPSALPFLPPHLAPAPIDPKVVGLQIDKDKTIAALLFYIRDLEAKIEKIREQNPPERFKKNSAKHQALLDEAKKALKKRRDELLPQLTEEMRKQVETAAQARWNQSFSQYANLRKLENMYRAEVLALEEFLQKFKKNAVPAVQDNREIKRLKHAFGPLAQVENKINALEIEEEAPQRIRWVGQKDEDGNEIEEVSIYTPSAMKAKLMATAPEFGLGCFLLILAGFEFCARKARGAEELLPMLPEPDEPPADSPIPVT